jgi:hypothetical protein
MREGGEALPRVMTEKTTQLKPGVEAREYEEQHYGILIEGMLDQGFSEEQIVEALDEAQAA